MDSEVNLTLHCNRCGHSWLRRDLTKDPIYCPHCRSAYWNRERVRKQSQIKVVKQSE